MESHHELDHEIDSELTNLAAEHDDIIIDSRMAWHFAKDTFKVLAVVDPAIAARRIMGDDRGKSEYYTSVDDAIKQLKERKTSENYRYNLLYGVNCADVKNFNLVIDTSLATPDAVARAILAEQQAWARETLDTQLLLSRHKLLPTMQLSEIDDERVRECQKTVAANLPLEKILVCEHENNYLIVRGHHRFAAQVKAECSLIACELLPAAGLPDCGIVQSQDIRQLTAPELLAWEDYLSDYASLRAE
jgi:cytidylate kinase